MEFVPALALLALVKKFVDFGKYLTNRDLNGIVTQLTAWGAGIVALFVGAQTDWAAGIAVGDMALSTLNGWSLTFVGLTIGSSGGLVADFFSAKQNDYELGKLQMTRKSSTHV